MKISIVEDSSPQQYSRRYIKKVGSKHDEIVVDISTSFTCQIAKHPHWEYALAELLGQHDSQGENEMIKEFSNNSSRQTNHDDGSKSFHNLTISEKCSREGKKFKIQTNFTVKI